MEMTERNGKKETDNYEDEDEERKSQTISQQLKQAGLCLTQIAIYPLEIVLLFVRGASLAELRCDDGSLAHFHWTLWTFFLIIFPGLVIAIYNITRKIQRTPKFDFSSMLKLVSYIVVNLLLLGPVWNIEYILLIKNKIKEKRGEKRHDDEEVKLYNILVMNKLFHAFLASYPILMFQAYMTVRETSVSSLKIITMATSLVSFVFSLSSSIMYLQVEIDKANQKKNPGPSRRERWTTNCLWITMIASSAFTLPFFAAYSGKGATLALFIVLVWPLFVIEHSSYMLLAFCLDRFFFAQKSSHDEEEDGRCRPTNYFNDFIGGKLKAEVKAKIYQTNAGLFHVTRCRWRCFSILTGLVFTIFMIFFSAMTYFYYKELPNKSTIDCNVTSEMAKILKDEFLEKWYDDFREVKSFLLEYSNNCTDPKPCDKISLAYKVTNQFSGFVEALYYIFGQSFKIDQRSVSNIIFLVGMTTSLLFFIIWTVRVHQMLPPTMMKPQRTKIIYMIGDVGAGKTAALQRFLRGHEDDFGDWPEPTRNTNVQKKDREIYGIPFHFQFYDMKGGATLTPEITPAPDVILIFYDINDSKSVQDVKKKYAKSVVKSFDQKKCVIVGAKTDVRTSGDDDEDSVFVTKATLTNPEMALSDYFQPRFGPGAFAFVQCSALDGEGIDELFDKVFRLAIGDRSQKFEKLFSAW